MYGSLVLSDEQKDLLTQLVERHKNVPKDKRERFYFVRTDSARPVPTGAGEVRHSHAKRFPASQDDIDHLISRGLLASSSDSAILTFVLTPEGLIYFEKLKEEMGQQLHKSREQCTRIWTPPTFRGDIRRAYEKWAEAASLLWSADSARQFTTIGHLCREAIQTFATELVDQYKPPDVEADPARTKNRVRAVLDLHKDKLGRREKEFLDSLIAYWSASSDLIQRQEHGAQKSGQELIWEDGRVVFQAASVMFEMDRCLSQFQ